MLTIGLITEGITDQLVIKKLVRRYLGDSNIPITELGSGSV